MRNTVRMDSCIKILFLGTTYATILHKLLYRQINQGLSFLDPLRERIVELFVNVL